MQIQKQQCAKQSRQSELVFLFNNMQPFYLHNRDGTRFKAALLQPLTFTVTSTSNVDQLRVYTTSPCIRKPRSDISMICRRPSLREMLHSDTHGTLGLECVCGWVRVRVRGVGGG